LLRKERAAGEKRDDGIGEHQIKKKGSTLEKGGHLAEEKRLGREKKRRYLRKRKRLGLPRGNATGDKCL